MNRCKEIGCWETVEKETSVAIDKTLPSKAVRHFSACSGNITYTWIRPLKEEESKLCYYHKKVKEGKITIEKRRKRIL